MNWEHLTAILWLRSRLSRNQWRRAGRLNAILQGFVWVAGTLVAVGGGVGGLYVGARVLPTAPPWVTWAVLGGVAWLFGLLWIIGVVVEIQRSEAIDLQRLLHLPVTLGQMFTINYLASLLTPMFLLFLPMLMGLAVGLNWSLGWRLHWLLPLILSGLFVVTAWTYCLRGWLVALMVNKRRRRAIIAGVTIGMILIGQVPNLLFNNPYTRNHLRSKERTRQQQTAQPSEPGTPDEPAAVGVALPWAGAWGIASLGFLLGGLGLRRAYRMTLRFYQGAESGRRLKVSPKSAQVVRNRSEWVERGVPGCSEEVSAMAWVFLRSLLRAPETKMALVTPVVLVLVFGSLNLGRHEGGPPPEFLRPFLVTGAAAFGLFAVLQLAANAFGTDRDGFRALVLLPVSRAAVLFAKNLALLPLAAVVTGCLLGLAALIWSVSWSVLLAGFLQFLGGYFFICIVGNYTSTRAPFRVAPGSLKPTKTTTQTTLLLFVLYLLFPVVLVPLAIPPAVAWLGAILLPVDRGVLNLLGSVLLLVIAGGVYRFSLAFSGEYLQGREQKILETLSSPVE